jgi:hypothetical protein
MSRRVFQLVKPRLARSKNRAGLPYDVVGGHAVASWVATIDEGAVRNTRDIDLLIRRADLPALTAALEQAGFVSAEVGLIDRSWLSKLRPVLAERLEAILDTPEP